MVLRGIFPTMHTLPDEAPPQSRNSSAYLRRGLFVIGIIPPPRSSSIFVIYILWSCIFNLSSTFYQPVAFGIGYVSRLSESSAGEILTSLMVSLNALSCSIKVLVVWTHVKRFEKANLIFDEMDKRLQKPEERRRVHAAVARSNRIFFTYMSIYNFSVIISFARACYLGVPMYQNYYPGLNWRASHWENGLQSFLEFFAMMGAGFQNVCVDCYTLIFVLPLRAHMANLADRLRQLGQDPDESPEQRHEKLIECIRDHKVVLRFCDTLRPIISGTIFVQLLVVGIVLGVTLIFMVVITSFAARIWAFNYMVAVLMETTPFCILCNYLVDDCYKLANALFESNWIDQDQRYKETLLQFLQKLQSPIVFLAGNMVAISVATNLTASKFSFSVFTLVKEMNIAEKLTGPH